MSSLAGPKRRRVVATACLIAPFGAVGADTSWTGTAADPYWDVAANWSAGPPLAATTRALLGSFDTTLRSGSFLADTVQGSGTLTMSGGELRLMGAGSSLGALRMSGGALSGSGTLALGALQWSGGSISEPLGVSGPVVTVHGPASLSGSLGFSLNAELRLMGASTWQPGASSIGEGFLTIGASGSFTDHATATHSFGGYWGRLVNDGRYLKLGAATTSMNGNVTFTNNGRVTVQEGTLSFNGDLTGSFTNNGLFEVTGGRADLRAVRGGIDNTGRVDVAAGALTVTLTYDSVFSSSGDWRVGRGATLALKGSDYYRAGGFNFTGGNTVVDGDLELRLARTTFSGASTLSGTGRVQVLEGSQLTMPGALQIGALRIAEPYVSFDGTGLATSRVSIGGALTTGRLDWEDGTLVVGGPVTVNGAATLSQSADILQRTGGQDSGKVMDRAFRFNGGVRWDGNSDLYGGGSIAIAAGTVFEDRNSAGTLDYYTGAQRPTRIAVVSVANDGTYLKNGAGDTVIQSAFANAGTVRSTGTGTLTFAGALDNRGALESIGSRVVAYGPLAQYAGGVLGGGRYLMRDGRIVLNLGTNSYGTGPATIWQNRADITLEGPAAKLATTWLGTEYDALSGLVSNAGTLTLRNGAALETNVAGFYLSNEGVVAIEQARLSVGAFLQSAVDGVTVATWVDGTLQAGRMDFTGGTLGAGGDGRIGSALLDGAVVSFASGLVFDVDVAGAGGVDLVTTHGTASLGGTLVVDFTGAVTPGTYRVLVADGGVSGAFDALRSDLGPQYEVTALYGGTYVDLSVAAVPEPATAALWLAGLGLLGAAARRRRA